MNLLKINVQKRHVDKLTEILKDLVEHLKAAPTEYGRYGTKRPDYDPNLESLTFKKGYEDVQKGGTTFNPDGTVNTNIMMLVLPALENAFVETGCSKDSIYLDAAGKKNMVSVGGTTGSSYVDDIGIVGYDLKAKLERLTEPRLREVARKTIEEDLQKMTAWFAKHKPARPLKARTDSDSPSPR